MAKMLIWKHMSSCHSSKIFQNCSPLPCYKHQPPDSSPKSCLITHHPPSPVLLPPPFSSSSRCALCPHLVPLLRGFSARFLFYNPYHTCSTLTSCEACQHSRTGKPFPGPHVGSDLYGLRLMKFRHCYSRKKKKGLFCQISLLATVLPC